MKSVAMILLALVMTAQLPDIGSWFQNAIQQLQDMIGGFIQWLQENVSQPVVERIFGFVHDVLGWFFSEVADYINTFFFEPVSDTLGRIGNSIFNAIKSVFDAIRQTFERMIGINTTSTT